MAPTRTCPHSLIPHSPCPNNINNASTDIISINNINKDQSQSA